MQTVRGSQFLIFLVAGVVLTTTGAFADWPQWRGPERNGEASSSPPLASIWPKDGPPNLWASEEFPEDSGEGSVVVADGRAYLFVNWTREEKIASRKVDSRVLHELGWFDQKEMPVSLLEAMEKARLTEAPRARRLRAKWAKEWVEANVSDENKQWRGIAERRLTEGTAAMSLKSLAKLGEGQNREFPNHPALKNWLDEQGFTDEEQEKIEKQVPTTVTVADDVLLCLGLADGKTLWKRALPGKPERNMASTTPAVTSGRLYFIGTTHVHCLDAKTGEPVWQTELPDGTSTSSMLVTHNLVIALAGRLVAFKRDDGKLAWRQEEVRGRRSSPALWTHGGTEFVLANADGRKLTCARVDSGEIAWTVPGGGDSSPVVQGDVAVVHSDDEKLGLVGYRLAPEGVKELWRLPHKGRGAASPVIHDGHVYLAGSERILCAKLEDGQVRWNKNLRAEISSPFVADRKIFSLVGNGADFMAFDASPDEFRELGKASVRVQRCPSPAFSEGRVLLRHKGFVACYDLRRSSAEADSGPIPSTR